MAGPYAQFDQGQHPPHHHGDHAQGGPYGGAPAQPAPYGAQPGRGEPTFSQQPNKDQNYGLDGSPRFQYEGSPFKDVWAALLFLGHLVIIIIVFASSSPKSSSTPSKPDADTEIGDIPVGKAVGVLIGGAFFAMAFAAGWLWVMRRFSGAIIKTMMIATFAFSLISAIMAFAAGAAFVGVITLLGAVLFAVYFYMVRHRIPFAEATLAISSKIVQDYPGPVPVAFGMVVVEIVWIAFWAAAFFRALTSSDSEGGNGGAYLMLLSFYWTTDVIQNLVHVTTAGVAATWYFFAEPKQPTQNALKRAATTSFGSICFGSLLTAIIATLREIVRQSRDRDDCLQCLVECILACLHDLLEYFNVYAFTQVAIYGKDFLTAAKDTWNMFKTKGFEVIINDDLTGYVLGLGALLGGVLTAGIMALAAYGSKDLRGWTTGFGVIGLFVGLGITYIVLKVVRSCIATLFVCWSEDPAALAHSHPASYEQMSDALSQRYGNEFVHGQGHAGGGMA